MSAERLLLQFVAICRLIQPLNWFESNELINRLRAIDGTNLFNWKALYESLNLEVSLRKSLYESLNWNPHSWNSHFKVSIRTSRNSSIWIQPASGDCSSDTSDTKDASDTRNAIDANGMRDEIDAQGTNDAINVQGTNDEIDAQREMRLTCKLRGCDWCARYEWDGRWLGTWHPMVCRCPDTAVDTHRPFAGSPNMPWILSSIFLPRFPNADCDSPGDELQPIENLKAPRVCSVFLFAESQTARLWQQVFRSPQTLHKLSAFANFRIQTSESKLQNPNS